MTRIQERNQARRPGQSASNGSTQVQRSSPDRLANNAANHSLFEPVSAEL